MSQSSRDAPASPPGMGHHGHPWATSPLPAAGPPGPGGHPVHGGVEGLRSGARALPITTVRARAAQAEAAPAAAGPLGWRGGGCRPPCRGTDPALVAAGGRGGGSAMNGRRAAAATWHGAARLQTAVNLPGWELPLHPSSTPNAAPPKNRAPDRAVRGSLSFVPPPSTPGKAPPDNGESFWLKSHQHTAPQKLPWRSYQAGAHAALMPGEQHQWGQGQRPRSAAEATHSRG